MFSLHCQDRPGTTVSVLFMAVHSSRWYAAHLDVVQGPAATPPLGLLDALLHSGDPRLQLRCCEPVRNKNQVCRSKSNEPTIDGTRNQSNIGRDARDVSCLGASHWLAISSSTPQYCRAPSSPFTTSPSAAFSSPSSFLHLRASSFFFPVSLRLRPVSFSILHAQAEIGSVAAVPLDKLQLQWAENARRLTSFSARQTAPAVAPGCLCAQRLS